MCTEAIMGKIVSQFDFFKARKELSIFFLSIDSHHPQFSKMFNTTPLRTRQTITPLPGTSPTPSTPTNYNRTLDSRRKALGAGGNRDRGTPVGRLLADEGMMMGIRSPRKIQTRSLSEK